MATRIERDSMGELEVPANAYYGAQTQRAKNNFPISTLKMPRDFIKAMGLIKGAAADVNCELKLLTLECAAAIKIAANLIAGGEFFDNFPVDVFQTGSGTSTNMNANEVIANIAKEKSGIDIHPNDHVNMGQSSNDVIPTAISISAALACQNKLLPSLNYLASALEEKASSLGDVTKTGRTHLMDAMPVTFKQELGGWLAQINQCILRIENSKDELCYLALGGTAVGTGINAHPEFGARVAKTISANTGLKFHANKNYFEALSSQDRVVALSGQLKVAAVAIMKIANDLRWMNSGPLAGLGEIELPAVQPGSSIMPGKVNPVIAESACMAAAQVIGNDTTITVAGQSGNFQLNVMLPLIAYNILQSIDILANTARNLADKSISGFKVNNKNIKDKLSRNPILVTALNPVIGYELGAEIAKKAYQDGLPVRDVAGSMTDISAGDLDRLLDPAELTKGGIKS